MFDASCITSSGPSLNDCLMVGPKLQDDLYDIMIRFRKYKYVLTADIKMMFRQVFINGENYKYHKVLWRRNPNEQLQIYELYIASAPYLAVKSLQKLAQLESESYPKASKVVVKDFYMDDVLTVCDTITELASLKLELINLLMKGGFELHKWNSNEQTILNNDIQHNLKEIKLDKNDISKTLGIVWNTKKDTLIFNHINYKEDKKFTKRKVLSEISKIYDPLGLIGPISFNGKFLMQQIGNQVLDGMMS